MNSKTWRNHGYKTIIRRGKIILYRPATEIIHWIPLDNGHWMEHENVNKAPWTNCVLTDLPDQLQGEIRTAVDKCYCDGCGIGLCDFCAGRR